MSCFLCCRLLVVFLSSLPTHQFAPTVEVFFHNQTHALCVEAVFDEIAVVGLVVNFQCEVAVGIEQITDVEVADETRGGVGVVTVAELTIDQ